MSVIEEAKAKIKDRGLKLVMPEGDDPRIAEAAIKLQQMKLAVPILFDANSVPKPDAAAIERLIANRPKLSVTMAAKLLCKPLYAAGGMVASGQADAMLAGVAHPTARVIEAALMTIGLSQGISTPSSFFLMQWSDRRLIFADCAVNVQPDAEQLADIVVATAANARQVLSEEPRIALLSFSTKGSGDHVDAKKVAAATEIAKSMGPELLIEGELQGDAALSPAVALRKVKHSNGVAGQANVLIFPDLDAGNIAYKLVQYLGGAEAIGPVLQGFASPVSDLSRGASVKDIVDTAVLLLSTIPSR